ncbi:thioredoxin domain-containing protein [Heliophilum fasciatum]|uniref:Spermatogenesis-associated protein 20-like TRX domain-containing protein n=1 Tax=Heliophilum fasciatum TaxID=35700 RepID=A0A4R2RRB1_9FIRM|nr:thioredoxin domain-containing protein [Heliophilum fasciatum]MCW2277629.1 uncharacterized protein YyaL (SSP411 family) [Heliophilum fasciatum]TCP64977.1 hypothetical protein EDD73_10747 [Heliophilum fasciatum]
MAISTTEQQPNQLIHEKSPYLLQHAHNPVNWYPWGDEAFTKAQQEGKPVLLSIGYSTCHWCHVMAHESFEDQDVAAYLNEHFVSIKVDREERPDIDHIYMTVCQAISGHGGWPLTVFLAPDKTPFFAGTYYPPKNTHGRPGFMELLEAIQEKWQSDRSTLITAGKRVTEMLNERITAQGDGSATAPLDKTALDKAFRLLSQQFDEQYGGFGHAPKFPTPHQLMFLLRHWHRTGEKRALQMVEKTLQSMHDGGIYDHLGGGFARYSTDEKWLVPHFEKMLYDNALLAMAYLEAYQETGKERYAVVAREIFTYVLRDMTSPEGGFYSAEDADSEGVEGKYYVWTPSEVIGVLGEDTGELFNAWYGVTNIGNFEGKNILHRIGTLDSLYGGTGDRWEAIDDPALEHRWPADWPAQLAKAREALLAARQQRIRPHKDDKILTAWNGLMIAALAMGARILGEPAYLATAEKALDMITGYLRSPRGRLLARYRDGHADYLGYVDDYAFVIWGLLELYQSGMNAKHLALALELQAEQDELFWDAEHGGYYFTGRDSEALITRPKETYDGAMPAGNSVAALNLLRLARLTGNPAHEQRAAQLLDSCGALVGDMPIGYTHLLMALQFAVMPTKEVVIVTPAATLPPTLLEPLQQSFLPDTVFLYRTGAAPAAGDGNATKGATTGGANGAADGISSLAPFTAAMTALNNEPTFYICQNRACQAPTTSLKEALAQIRG